MKKAKIATILLTASIALMSCEKTTESQTVSESPQVSETLKAIDDMNLANKLYQDVGNSSDDALILVQDDLGPGLSEKTAGQPIVTVTPQDLTSWPKVISIDFGNGMTGPDGIHREGILMVLSTNWYQEKNSKHTTSFIDYYQNGYLLEGIQVTKNLGTNSDGHLVYDVLISDGQITTPDGKKIYYDQESTRTWIAGDNTPLYIWDDEYLLDGKQWGYATNSVKYSLDVIDPLHFSLLPREILSGTMSVDVGALKNLMIDYEKQTVSINGVNYPF